MRSEADSSLPSPQDYESPYQLRSMFGHQFQNCRGEQTLDGGWASDQGHAGGLYASCEYQPTEVLILGQDDALFRQREVNQILVHRAVLKFIHREHGS